MTSTKLNEIHHHDSHYVLSFYPHSAYAAFDCHRLRTFYGEVAQILLWRPGFFKSSMAFSASKSCGGSVNWGSNSQFLCTAAQPDLDFDFACFIAFLSTKLSTLNMVSTQRT